MKKMSYVNKKASNLALTFKLKKGSFKVCFKPYLPLGLPWVQYSEIPDPSPRYM